MAKAQAPADRPLMRDVLAFKPLGRLAIDFMKLDRGKGGFEEVEKYVRCMVFRRNAPRFNHTFCTKHNGRQLGSKVFICNKLDVSKHPCSTLQHVMLNAAAMYRPVQCPAVNTQYYMIYYYISL